MATLQDRNPCHFIKIRTCGVDTTAALFNVVYYTVGVQYGVRRS
jgi:hypothetical protein